MSATWLFLIVLALAVAGYVVGRGRALASAGGDSRHLHSLPNYYGINAALFVLVPSLLLLAIWLIVQPVVSESNVQGMIPADS